MAKRRSLPGTEPSDRQPTTGHPHSPAEPKRARLVRAQPYRVDIGSDDLRAVDNDGDPDSDRTPPTSAWARLGWFVLLWCGGVLTITVVGLAIRAAILP